MATYNFVSVYRGKHSFPRYDKGCLNVNDCNECPFIDSVSEASDSTPPFTDEDISERSPQTHEMTAKDWRNAQLQDLSLSFVIKCLEAGLQAIDAKYIKEWDKALLSNQVLHIKVSLNGHNFLQLVIPPAFREDVFEVLHDDLGHQGRDRTMPLIKQRVFLAWHGYLYQEQCCIMSALHQKES